MKETYVTYEQAVKLKELGFGWECNHSYLYKAIDKSGNPHLYHVEMRDWNNFDNEVECFSVPRLDQAQKWLREVNGIHVEPCLQYGTIFKVVVQSETRFLYKTFEKGYNSYELALSAGIDTALKLLTDKLNK